MRPAGGCEENQGFVERRRGPDTGGIVSGSLRTSDFLRLDMCVALLSSALKGPGAPVGLRLGPH